ncbi:hypothetical protein Raf01_93520 [Rugosimonospora africana]|uniref:Uncharacterized protein n=1 Tax=Rugosimonospora africana TaxID=556532 RepID=A0A8J3R1B8_9ACTN|nr:hypothetical protein Raf01_93520 [Rugosimonospora africana]
MLVSDGHEGGHAGQDVQQVCLPASAGYAQQYWVAGAEFGQPLVAAEFGQDDRQRFGAVVVFEEEPDVVACGAPDAVAVGVDVGEGIGGRGVLLGPPAQKTSARISAGVGDEVDEQLVGAQQVGQAAAADDAFGAFDTAPRALTCARAGSLKVVGWTRAPSGPRA